MKSTENYGAAINARLGDKTMRGIAQAVSDARSDLTDYRTVRPRYVGEASERGLANWIHDRLCTLFPDADEVRLAAGYRWYLELRAIKEAVVSLRDGMDHVVWAVALILEPESNAVHIRPLDDEAPALPFIDIAEEAVDDDETLPEAASDAAIRRGHFDRAQGARLDSRGTR